MSESEMRMPSRDAIEAYLSKDGYICLTQTDLTGEAATVMLLPQDIPNVVEWLHMLAKKLPWSPEKA